MLAAAPAGLDARLQPGRHGLAPPAEFRARLLEAAGRVRPGRGDAGAQVAREIQRLGPHPLGRPHLRERAHPRARLAPGAHLPRCLGRCGVSVALPARAEPARVAVADARVASDDCDPGRAGRVEHPLEPAEARPPVVARRHAAAHRSSLSERGPRCIPERAGPRLGRLRSWPVVRLRGPVLALGFAVFALAAALDHAWVAAAVLGLGAFLPALRTLEQCTTGVATITQALRGSRLGGT